MDKLFMTCDKCGNQIVLTPIVGEGRQFCSIYCRTKWTAIFSQWLKTAKERNENRNVSQ